MTPSKLPDVFGVIVTLNVRPERKTEMLAQMRHVHERMRAEPTFLNSAIYVDSDEPNRIVVHEQWRDRRNFEEVEMRRDYRRERERSLPDMLRKPREIRFYDIVLSQSGSPDE